MAFKITGHNLETHRATSTEDLKRMFDKAVGEIYQADPATGMGMRYRSPIVSRARALGISQANAEKRALSEAARALAQLWKV